MCVKVYFTVLLPTESPLGLNQPVQQRMVKTKTFQRSRIHLLCPESSFLSYKILTLIIVGFFLKDKIWGRLEKKKNRSPGA